MIDQIILDLPILALFLKFMLASTMLLGGVWLLEKIGVINSPDMSESAWKLAIFASFVALLPVSFTSNNLIIPINETAVGEYVGQPENQQFIPQAAPQPEPVLDERPVLRSNSGAELVSPEVQQRIEEVREQFQQPVAVDAQAKPESPIVTVAWFCSRAGHGTYCGMGITGIDRFDGSGCVLFTRDQKPR